MKEIEYLNIDEVKPEGSLVIRIGFKPKKAPITIAIVGVLMLMPNNLILRLLGLFFIAMACAVLFYVKDYRVMDIYDQGLLVYEDDKGEKACFIGFDEIECWEVVHEGGYDSARFQLYDGTVFFKNTFEVNKVFKTLNIIIKEKEAHYIRSKQQNDSVLSIPQALDNIKKKRNAKKQKDDDHE